MTRHADRLALLLLVLAAWQGLYWLAGSTALSSPAATAARLWTLLGRPAFRAEALGTAAAFLLSAALSVSGGLLLGCVLGLNRLLGRVMEPVLAALYALPKVTLYPVVLLLFGLGASAKVAFGVMHGLVPLALLTAVAVLQLSRVHLRTARALRLTRPQLLRHVVWPGIRDQVVAGIRVAVPLTLLGVLIGEMFASRHGLGSLAMRAMENNDTATTLAIACLLTAAALAVNALLGSLSSGAPPPAGAGR